jgi:hypothetical protein
MWFGTFLIKEQRIIHTLFKLLSETKTKQNILKGSMIVKAEKFSRPGSETTWAS